MNALKLAVLATALAAAGCSGLVQRTDGDFAAAQERADKFRSDAAKKESPTSALVTHEDGMWISHSAVKMDEQERLPAVFLQPASFDRSVASIAEFAQRLSLRARMRVLVTPDAAAAAQRTLSAEQGDRSGGLQQAPAPLSRPAVTPVMPSAGGTVAPVRITYLDGNLKGLLDAAAARFGVYWRHAGNGIEFYYTSTRSFQIRAIPGDASMNATVGSSTSGSSTGAAGSAAADVNAGAARTNAQNTAVSSRLSVFDGIEKSVGSMLSPQGKVVASPATGTLTVTDTPPVLQRVARLIDDENQTLSRQVMINVTVLSVAAADLDDYGINWNLVYGDLSRRYGITSSYTPQAGSAAFSAAILNTSTSPLAGSTLVMNALSSQGRVRRDTSASVATLNNQPVPVQVARQTAYLKSSSTQLTANVGSTTTLEPGTVTSGFNMTILPHVLSNGTVMLHFTTDISSLRSIRKVSGGGSGGQDGLSIETPEIDTRNFLQRVAMKSGETLVISGFEQTDANVDRKGVGSPGFFGLGGGVNAGSTKEVIVILVTPIAMTGA